MAAPRKKLGELLLSEGLIDEVQLSSAIGHQRNWGGKLGSTLVELGFIEEDEIARVLQRQLKQDCLSDKDLEPDPEVMELVSGHDCMNHEILPLRMDGNTLVLAMSNPYDLALIDELGFKLGRRVRGVMAVESAIKRAIKRHYYGEAGGRNYRVDMAQSDPDAPMEVVHQEEERARKAKETPPPPPDKVEPSAEIVSKALAYLLIEKGIIKRDELIAKMKQLHEKSQG